ncbi:LLM class flavin-dependent oxidoreductase [Actinoplanes couchii]|uniref:Luciferase-like domain-containing protein n=1 Tax=Actinoplanes couchii TaxID=403638 RepID=A0ABQ3X067_9ACTN|nr:LLM class flavin-dependent oxidoreductase [Actinoplanes couchii]MDR6316168.1 alkanesulfonate monooxygenase SsuD/methylene tetrahydromethanopterin reductase-like flavin-dependent oxidoreductase (luciferase family) [Actinoplanes couchii]GID51783.1 hypothetical protein Aco03nite_001870 [Actinoplanes couchii]
MAARSLLAKQTATLDRMSGGRFVFGVGIGGRADDHRAAGVPVSQRGRILDAQLGDLRRIWAGQAYRQSLIGPAPATVGGPRVLIGGFAPAALSRVARFADGFLCAAPLTWAGRLVGTVRDQWAEAGRPGRPRLVCQINVAIGPASVIDRARQAIGSYYAFVDRPDHRPGPITDPVRLAETVAAYREFGADELMLYCWADDPHQVEALAPLLTAGPAISPGTP